MKCARSVNLSLLAICDENFLNLRQSIYRNVSVNWSETLARFVEMHFGSMLMSTIDLFNS